jgi:three-Cys-motif partner protein
MTIKAIRGYEPNYIDPAQRIPRENGLYAKTKIEAFIRYCLAAERVFKGQKDRGKIRKIVHFEPFCGPGIDITKDGTQRFEGTPLRAVKELKNYDIFIFNDNDIDVMNCLFSELKDLRLHENPDVEVILSVQDANESIGSLGEVLPKKVDSTYAFLGTAIVDPNGLHLRWDSAVLLAKRRLDLLEMVPTHIDLVRNLNNPSSPEDHIKLWLGNDPVSEDWVEVLTQYETKLKSIYKHVHGVSTNPLPQAEYVWVERRYHLISASNCSNDVAKNRSVAISCG